VNESRRSRRLTRRGRGGIFLKIYIFYLIGVLNILSPKKKKRCSISDVLCSGTLRYTVTLILQIDMLRTHTHTHTHTHLRSIQHVDVFYTMFSAAHAPLFFFFFFLGRGRDNTPTTKKSCGTGAPVNGEPLSRQQTKKSSFFPLWRDASSRSHFPKRDCRAPSESIDNPARPWQRQQVPPLPDRLAPARLRKTL